jgi:hypothetical protein
MPDPTVDARLQAALTRVGVWATVLPEARRRLLYDAYLAVRAKSAARLLEEDRRALGWTWGHRDEDLALTAAALAIVVSDHPELITGSRPLRRPPREVLMRVLAAVVFGHDATRRVEELATLLLEALELDGYEVTVRADRFATLPDDGRRLRIPLRGRCGVCRLEVFRHLEAPMPTEVLIGPWRHAGEVDGDAGHTAALVEGL